MPAPSPCWGTSTTAAGAWDHNEALKWFRRAANQDDVAAQFYLGLMFSEGQGVPQDHAEAANWFRRAANLGDAQAQYNLGLSYANGESGKARQC
jgi:uncharacterized protein